MDSTILWRCTILNVMESEQSKMATLEVCASYRHNILHGSYMVWSHCTCNIVLRDKVYGYYNLADSAHSPFSK